jgi:hypothetical protein
MNRLACLALLFAGTALADPAWDSESAMLEILVNERVVNVDYTVNEDGRIIILFGAAVPDWQMREIMAKFEAHPAIPSVLRAKHDDNFCPIR